MAMPLFAPVPLKRRMNADYRDWQQRAFLVALRAQRRAHIRVGAGALAVSRTGYLSIILATLLSNFFGSGLSGVFTMLVAVPRQNDSCVWGSMKSTTSVPSVY